MKWVRKYYLTKKGEKLFKDVMKMKTKIINFAPKNKFYSDILEGRKNQTIRDKSIEVGQKVALWEKSRGMKKGIYCITCFSYWGKEGETGIGIPCAHKAGFEDLFTFPRKIKDAMIKECIEIWMRYDRQDNQEAISFGPADSVDGEIIFNDKPQHQFVKADTPKWTNQQFIDFFKKAYPQMKKEPVKMYLWKW